MILRSMSGTSQGLGAWEEWDSRLVYALHGRSRSGVLRGVIAHAVACVGAWQREDALPEPNHAFREARESM